MKKKIILSIAIIILVALTALVSIYITNNQKEQEEKNKEEFSKNIINPDRIIYKNQEKYYEIKPENEIYKIIIEQMSKKIDTSKKETIISQEELDDMHNQESFIEFDYNTVSKNYILILNNKGKFAKMMDSGAELIKSNIDTNSIKKEIDGKINNTKYYTMDNKEYISKNTLVSVEYKYLQQFKNINNQIYQTVIKDNESLELYTAMCNLEFDEEIPNDVFNNNVIVLTLAIPKDITVKINIGNLRYYYDNKKNNYESEKKFINRPFPSVSQRQRTAHQRQRHCIACCPTNSRAIYESAAGCTGHSHRRRNRCRYLCTDGQYDGYRHGFPSNQIQRKDENQGSRTRGGRSHRSLRCPCRSGASFQSGETAHPPATGRHLPGKNHQLETGRRRRPQNSSLLPRNFFGYL